MQIYPL